MKRMMPTTETAMPIREPLLGFSRKIRKPNTAEKMMQKITTGTSFG